MNSEKVLMGKKETLERNVALAIHLCIWIYIFVSPLLQGRWGEPIDWSTYFRRLYFPVSSCVVFYVNYFYLVPHFILDSKQTRKFVVYNVLLIVLLMVSREFYVSVIPPVEKGAAFGKRFMKHHAEPPAWFWWFFMLRNFISLASLTLLALAVRLSVQWRKAEKARRDAELGRREAEIQNLKNQINPHFLLNTLNNIYALTAFDTEQAQSAILKLSSMLRYILYEDQAKFVDLQKEQDFLTTYVSLMRIRLSSSVDVGINFDVPKDRCIQVAPLIFISLVENAFKHGVSPTNKSFIAISLSVDGDTLRFSCRNSNFPKNAQDKSPGGIGLHQVASRLEHSYPKAYRWNYGVTEEGDVYYSEIEIKISPR